jgi:hypothetical protein
LIKITKFIPNYLIIWQFLWEQNCIIAFRLSSGLLDRLSPSLQPSQQKISYNQLFIHIIAVFMKLVFLLGILTFGSFELYGQIAQIKKLKNQIADYQQLHPDYQRDTAYIHLVYDLTRTLTNYKPDSALILLRQAEPWVQNSKNQTEIGHLYLLYAETFQKISDFSQSMAYANQAKSQAQKLNNLSMECQALQITAFSQLLIGEYQDALRGTLTLLSTQEKYRLPIDRNYIETYRVLVFAYMAIGDVGTAFRYNQTGMDLAQKHSIISSELSLLQQKSTLLLYEAKYEEAIRLIFSLLEKSKQLGYLVNVPYNYKVLADIYKGLQKTDSAKIYYQESINSSRELQDDEVMGLALNAYSRLNMEQNNLDEALRQAHEALAIGNKAHRKDHRNVNLGLLSEIYARKKEFELASTTTMPTKLVLTV